MGTIHCLLDLIVLLCYKSPFCSSIASGSFPRAPRIIVWGESDPGAVSSLSLLPEVSNKRHLPTIIIDVIITHLVASLTGLIIILMFTIPISPAESLIWGLPPCRQVVVTVCLFSCILLVVHKDSAVEFKGNCIWSWDRCCCVISFPI